MSRRTRRGAVAGLVAAMLPALAGVAVAETVPVVVEKNTADGYHIKLTIENVYIQTVPNMAGAPLVREGFITATSKLEVTCPDKTKACGVVCPPREPSTPSDPAASACGEALLTKKALSMSAQVGCPTDLSGGAKTVLQPNGVSSIPVAGILQGILPPPAPAPPTDFTDIALLPTANVSPSVSVDLNPGYIRDVSLGQQEFPPTAEVVAAIENMRSAVSTFNEIKGDLPGIKDRGALAAALVQQQGEGTQLVSVQNSHLEVDQQENSLGVCGGAVAVRVFAHAEIRTLRSTDTLDNYGDIFTL